MRNHGAIPLCPNSIRRRLVKRHLHSQYDRPGNTKRTPEGNTRPREGTGISH